MKIRPDIPKKEVFFSEISLDIEGDFTIEEIQNMVNKSRYKKRISSFKISFEYQCIKLFRLESNREALARIRKEKMQKKREERERIKALKTPRQIKKYMTYYDWLEDRYRKRCSRYISYSEK